GAPAEEQRPVIGLEGPETAVGVTLRDRRAAGVSSELLQRLAELLARREALLRVADETTIDDRREARIDAGSAGGERGGIELVRELDVAVEDALAMGGGQPFREVDADREDARPGNRSGQPVEGLTPHELRHQIRPVVELPHPIDRRDVGMLHARGGPSLDEEA